jgi:hypothetical protein
MNASEPDVQAPMLALLNLVEAGRAQQCAQILGEARAQATAVRGRSIAEARARVRQAFDEQRRHHAERLDAAQARLATQRRLHAQQHTAALLALAREQLPHQLLAGWLDAPTRAAWVAGTLAAVRRQLPTGDWTVCHAAGWPAAERAAVAAPHLVFVEEPALRAGLKVAAAGNVVDATLGGLLAGRAEFEARLLRALETSP